MDIDLALLYAGETGLSHSTVILFGLQVTIRGESAETVDKSFDEVTQLFFGKATGNCCDGASIEDRFCRHRLDFGREIARDIMSLGCQLNRGQDGIIPLPAA